MRLLRSALIVVALSLYSTQAYAAEIVIDFEDLAEFDDVANHYGGVTFTGATVLTAGVSLNELDFPPVSGLNVAFNLLPTINVDFSTPVSSVTAYFTYLSSVTLTAYSGTTVVGSATSTLLSNIGSNGGPTNELIELAFSGGITSLIISAGDFGGSFVLDDFTAHTLDEVPQVPEPATATLLLIGAGTAWATRRRRARS
jgi:hypothetical protein